MVAQVWFSTSDRLPSVGEVCFPWKNRSPSSTRYSRSQSVRTFRARTTRSRQVARSSALGDFLRPISPSPLAWRGTPAWDEPHHDATPAKLREGSTGHFRAVRGEFEPSCPHLGGQASDGD